MTRIATIDKDDAAAALRLSMGGLRRSIGLRLAERMGAAFDDDRGEVVLSREQTEREMGTPDTPARPFVAEAIRP